jgi:hypothetical protein
MVKTTVYLDDDVVRSLRAIAAQSRKPQAQLIREALRTYTSSARPPLPLGIGMFDSGHADTTSRRKQLLRQAAISKK